jgi:hypothetical protein
VGAGFDDIVRGDEIAAFCLLSASVRPENRDRTVYPYDFRRTAGRQDANRRRSGFVERNRG